MDKDTLIEIEFISPIFTKLDLEASFLYLTKTGYEKSIMDAIGPFREFLKRNAIHDYNLQKQGQENKKQIETYIITADDKIKTKTSFYRPNTKKGDPRVWVYKLGKYCNPNSLLAFITNKQILYVLNLSNESVKTSLIEEKYVFDILKEISNEKGSIAKELFDKIKEINKLGFVESIGTSDPGVGETLEHLLGIKRNPSKNPDYKGIELKASREKYKPTNRTTLFTRVPDWKNSKGMTNLKLIKEYGYCGADKNGVERLNLNCTLKANTPNPQGLYLKVDEDEDLLINRSLIDDEDKYVLQWDLEELRSALAKKHKETFWVGAESKIIEKDGEKKEYFRYHTIVHTKNPNISMFSYLIESGVITVDYIMHKYKDKPIRSHGVPFKLHKNNLKLLFSDPEKYNLDEL